MGSNIRTTISNCYATANVSAIGDYAGGLVGWIYNENVAAVSNCYATGNVTGNYYVGGLVGTNLNNSISNCYATGNVTGNKFVGGLIGNSQNADISNCIAANASVIAASAITNRVNRITGNISGTPSDITTLANNYANAAMVVKANGANVSITPNLNGQSGADAALPQLQSETFYTTPSNWSGGAWDIANPSGIWKICDGAGLPFLRWQGVLCEGETGIAETAAEKISIYPNPAKYELKIITYELIINNVQITDLAGKIIYNSSFILNNSINVSALPQGVYLVKIYTDKGITTQKFIKE